MPNRISAEWVGVIATIAFGLLGFWGGQSYEEAYGLQLDQFTHQKGVDADQKVIQEAQLAAELLGHLTSEDELERALAIETINYGMETFGAQLLTRVIGKDGNSSDATVIAAKDAITEQRNRLAANLFSAIKDTRYESFKIIEAGWTNDQEIVGNLLKEIEDHNSKETWPVVDAAPNEWLFETGVLNVFNVLGRFSKETLSSDKADICSITNEQMSNGPQTKKAALYLQRQAGGCS
ncbi:hypothetical protein KO498_15660 [Lentibacter algarum]|uniref:hypothetical protein n=1 Tax=Lentibacter algarum TaxID=576131 RepID=UPI001C081AEC|nr:hypothetical protein [Lentibacter algarum]MBU2983244.1 hypothetical protein [Lentibacter algarum]